MKVPVIYVSRHGATAGIANAIAGELRNAGIDAEVLAAENVQTLDGYDAVVLGSALYMGQWLKPARGFVQRYGSKLSSVPVWLFSSGPLDDPPFPREESAAVAKLAAELNARGHVTFPGKLDRGELGLVEEIMTSALHAPEGDFRDWTAIGEWARSIAGELQSGTHAAPGEPS